MEADMIKNLIRRWRWLQAWKSDLQMSIINTDIRAEYIRRYNHNKFWWMKELKDET